MENNMPKPLLIGTKTKWGTLECVACIEGERYYFMINKHGDVSMMPWAIVHEMEVEDD